MVRMRKASVLGDREPLAPAVLEHERKAAG